MFKFKCKNEADGANVALDKESVVMDQKTSYNSKSESDLQNI